MSKLSNPEKILYPNQGITKLDLYHYYEQISPYMLPHLKDRPISMERFPDGIDGEHFFQKEVPEYFPKYFQRVKVISEEKEKDHGVVNNKNSLLYLANLASIHIHTWMSRADHLENPDIIIWDIDPMDGNFEKVRTAARLLRVVFQELKLSVFIKLTGSRGVHLVLPIVPEYDTSIVFRFSKDVSHFIARSLPKFFTIQFSKEKRGKKVYIDYNRNRYAQTAIAPYSARALDGAPVAVPITWTELDDETILSQSFNIFTTLERIKEIEDPWCHFFENRQSLKESIKTLDKIYSKFVRS